MMMAACLIDRKNSGTDEQQNSRSAEQQNSRTAEQQNSRSVEQQNSDLHAPRTNPGGLSDNQLLGQMT